MLRDTEKKYYAKILEISDLQKKEAFVTKDERSEILAHSNLVRGLMSENKRKIGKIEEEDEVGSLCK